MIQALAPESTRSGARPYRRYVATGGLDVGSRGNFSRARPRHSGRLFRRAGLLQRVGSAETRNAHRLNSAVNRRERTGRWSPNPSLRRAGRGSVFSSCRNVCHPFLASQRLVDGVFRQHASVDVIGDVAMKQPRAGIIGVHVGGGHAAG